MENPGFPLILKKAQDLLVEAENLVKYLQERGLAEPDFTVRSAEHPQSREFDKIRIALTQAAEDAILLANGPVNWLRTFFCHHHDLGAWQTALRFNYFSIIPLEKPMSVKEIAEKAGMDEDRLSRVMKLLASQRCFHEVEENVYEHTSLSALIARDETIKAAISFQADEMFEAASLTATSIQKAPYQSIPEHSAFNIRFGVSPYQWYTSNPERGARFAAAMAGLAKMNNDTVELRDRFPWDSLGHQTVVDVGGGSGHISIFLAKEFPNLEFIVQDINPGMLSQGPQQPNYPEVGEACFIHEIIHNYNDATSVKIFKSFIPAMEKSSASLLINDMVLPPANTEPKVEEHHLRQVDIAMLNGYAAKQRTLDEFSSLLKQADERFEVVQLHGKGVMGLIEVHLNQQH